MVSHHQTHKHPHPRARPNLRTRIIHASLVALRITIVIIAVHFGVKYLELHGIFSRLGKTADFACGSVVDYLLFGIGGSE